MVERVARIRAFEDGTREGGTRNGAVWLFKPDEQRMRSDGNGDEESGTHESPEKCNKFGNAMINGRRLRADCFGECVSLANGAIEASVMRRNLNLRRSVGQL